MATRRLPPHQADEIRNVLQELESQVDSGAISDDLLARLDALAERRVTRAPVAHRAPDRDILLSPAVTTPVARCRVVLREEYGSTADVRHIVDVLNAMVSGVTVATIARHEGHEDAQRAWDIVRRAGLHREAHRSFSPDFASTLSEDGPRDFGNAEQIKFVPARGPNDSSWYLPDPMSVEVYTGALSWVQRELAIADPALYRGLFSFATLQRVQRRSPTAIIMLISFALAVPAALVFACLKTAEHFQRSEVDLQLRRADVRMREAEADQAELRTRASARRY